MINSLKMMKKYNELLKRQKKAEGYLNNSSIKMEIITKNYIPEYQKIVRQLSALILYLNPSKDEILNGFEIIGGIDL